MGAGYRLSQLAQSAELNAGAKTELAAITRELNEAAGRLERLLATLQRDRERVGPDGAKDRARGRDGDDQAGRRRREQADDDEGRGGVAGGQVERRRQGPEAGEGDREPGP